jgi:hypothetical protein
MAQIAQKRVLRLALRHLRIVRIAHYPKRPVM